MRSVYARNGASSRLHLTKDWYRARISNVSELRIKISRLNKSQKQEFGANFVSPLTECYRYINDCAKMIKYQIIGESNCTRINKMDIKLIRWTRHVFRYSICLNYNLLSTWSFVWIIIYYQLDHYKKYLWIILSIHSSRHFRRKYLACARARANWTWHEKLFPKTILIEYFSFFHNFLYIYAFLI